MLFIFSTVLFSFMSFLEFAFSTPIACLLPSFHSYSFLHCFLNNFVLILFSLPQFLLSTLLFFLIVSSILRSTSFIFFICASLLLPSSFCLIFFPSPHLTSPFFSLLSSPFSPATFLHFVGLSFCFLCLSLISLLHSSSSPYPFQLSFLPPSMLLLNLLSFL